MRLAHLATRTQDTFGNGGTSAYQPSESSDLSSTHEDAHKLGNRGRASEQPAVPATFADCKAAKRRGLAELWEAAFRDNDDNSISEVRKLALRVRNPRDPIELLPRGQAVQVFRMRAEHTLLRGSMFRTKWTPDPSCRLCGSVVESGGAVALR